MSPFSPKEDELDNYNDNSCNSTFVPGEVLKMGILSLMDLRVFCCESSQFQMPNQDRGRLAATRVRRMILTCAWIFLHDEKRSFPTAALVLKQVFIVHEP